MAKQKINITQKQGKALRNIGGGQPELKELKKYRFLIARDAATAVEKDEGNFSKDIKNGKVKASDVQLYVKEGNLFFPLGTRTLQVVDMHQFAEAAPEPAPVQKKEGRKKVKLG